MLGTGLLIFGAGFVEGSLRYALWIAAIAVNVVGPYVADRSAWRIHPGHFSERHGLFVIIALVESIVAAGVGIEGQALDGRLLLAAALVLTVAAAQWWTYFDIGVRVAERALQRAEGDERGRLARDSYTFIHLPMVAGIILFAFGAKKALAALVPVAHAVEAIVALALVAAAFWSLIAYELLRYGDARQRMRHTEEMPA